MDFSDLIGQDHVARTLANAIAQDRVAHAFLFTGVRGVGKTTSARILAKALNCMAQDGPTASPCLQCPACKDIAAGSDMDVQEIDGASYNGVDEVRRLQESLPYRPSRDRHKIIIVDEVHMLSQSAWNALLKTLEEPPSHVKFIFATTEVHKVPITILSRVQRFDFKLIPSSRIIDRLRHVLTHERIEAEEGALSIIARQAAGSMRDAMSLLDQVIAWNASSLTGEGVARVLGVPSRQVLYDLTRALLDGQPQPALTLVHDLAAQGFEMAQVAKDLLALLRDVVVAATCDNSAELIDLPEAELADVRGLAEHPVDDLLRLHQGFSKGYDEVLRSGQPRAGLEMLLVRLARRPPLIPINDLVDRLIRLEKRLAVAGSPPGRPGGGGQASRPRPERLRGQSEGPAGLGATTARPTPAQPPAARAPRRDLQSSTPPTRGSGPPRLIESTLPKGSQPPNALAALAAPGTQAAAAQAPSAPVPATQATALQGTLVAARAVPAAPAVPETPLAPAAPAGACGNSGPSKPTARSVPEIQPSGATEAASAAQSATPPTTDAVPAPALTEAPPAPKPSPAKPRTATSPRPLQAKAPPKSPLSLPPWEPLAPLERWRQIVDTLRERDPKLGAFLDHAQIHQINNEAIELSFERTSVFADVFQDAATRNAVLGVATEWFGQSPKLVVHEEAPVAEGGTPRTVFEVDRQSRQARQREAIDTARQHPVVLEAIRVLGARVKHIELPKD